MKSSEDREMSQIDIERIILTYNYKEAAKKINAIINEQIKKARIDEEKLIPIIQDYMRKNSCCIGWEYVKEIAHEIAKRKEEWLR